MDAIRPDSLPPTLTCREPLSEEEKNLLAHAVVFARTSRYSSHIPSAISMNTFLDYVNDVIHQPRYKTSPLNYLREWEYQRGTSQNLLLPEDIAFAFLVQYENSLKWNCVVL